MKNLKQRTHFKQLTLVWMAWAVFKREKKEKKKKPQNNCLAKKIDGM